MEIKEDEHIYLTKKELAELCSSLCTPSSNCKYGIFENCNAYKIISSISHELKKIGDEKKGGDEIWCPLFTQIYIYGSGSEIPYLESLLEGKKYKIKIERVD